MKYKFNSIVLIVMLANLVLSISCKLPGLSSENRSASTDSKSNSETTKEVSETKDSNISKNCQNAYYPVGPNVERKYSIVYPKNSIPKQEYSERYIDFKENGFVAKTDFKDVNTTINWVCTPEGLLATQYGNSIDIKGGTTANIDTLESKGVSFLAETRWNKGEKWVTDYTIKQTIKNPNGQMTTEANGTVNQSGEVLETEEINVPAGKFQTIKVKVKTILDLTVKVNGVSVPTKVNIDTVSWFAKDVGMVKSETGLGGMGNATTELLSYSGTK